MKLEWKNKGAVLQNVNDKRLLPFLFHEASLTHFIQQSCNGAFSVELISESWQQSIEDESALLSMTNNAVAFIRKSLLKCDGHNLIFARTVIPKKTLSGKNQKLTELGATSLGDVLFNNKSTYRSGMHYAKIPVNCELHKEATKSLGIGSDLWGRRSIVYIEQQPLLITEIFLPAILECGKS